MEGFTTYICRMTQWKYTLAFFFVLLGSTFMGMASLNGQITADPTEGCAPLVGVQFTSPAGASNINWDFGDGTSSNLEEPTHTYTQAGTYTVSYTSSAGNEEVTVTVFGNPAAEFTSSLPITGCLGLTVDFIDNSTGGGGTDITGRDWSFGDGAVDNANNPNPSHTYTLAGSFDVILTVTDANGCDSTVVMEDYVSISEEPTVIISSNPADPSACAPPLTVNFSGAASFSNSPFSDDLTFNWDFGNGTESSAASPPAQLFNEAGTFNVVLTVTDDTGCSSTLTQVVQVDAPVASFSVPNAINDTICSIGTFVNTSTPGSYTWDFGDGSAPVEGSDFAIDHEFPGAGAYEVTLSVDAGGCDDDTTIVVVVEEVTADFIMNPNYTCSYPFDVQYTDQSINAVSWDWVFGDGDTSIEQNPTHTYDFTNSDPYYIYEEMTLTTALIAISEHGCTDTLFVPDVATTFIPTARFYPDVSEGCVPLTVNLNDLSTSNEEEEIVSWTFNYDNGETEVFTDPENMSYTFTETGEYEVYLIIENAAGCIDTSYVQPIVVGDLPSPDFMLDTILVCPLDTVQFSDLTPEGDSLDTWNFDSADGAIWHCLNDSEPSWIVYNDVGFQDLTLTGGYNGCYDSLTIEDAIEVTGAIGKISHACDCTEPMFYQFVGDIRGDAQFWDWNFGDGDTLIESTETAVDHTYEESGDYWVKLTVYDTLSSCQPFTDSLLIKVRNLTAQFSVMDTIVCVGDPVEFDASMSADVNDTCMQGYQWYFDDGEAPFRIEDSVYTYMFNGSVEHDVRLVTKDVNGCRDTMEMRMYAFRVDAAFDADTLMGCADPPFTVNFDDMSTGDTTLVSWEWDFGDGNTDEGEQVSNEFGGSFEGSFTVNLTVTDIFDCPGSATAQVIPFVPNANFGATSTRFICQGQLVSFSASNPFHTEYEWDFGGLGTSGESSPDFVFEEAGLYDVTLSVVDTFGCRNSFTRTEYVDVQAFPDTDFISWADTLDHLCYPLNANFTDQTDGMGSPYTRVWDFGNGDPVVGTETVGTQYTAPGEYVINLTTTTSYGCVDSSQHILEVEGPVADFSLEPSPICRGQEVTFNITEQTDVAFWSWDFGDGFTESGGDPVSHIYDISPSSGQTLVSLVYWSPDSACEASTFKFLDFLPVFAEFDRNNEILSIDTNHCVGIPDVFTFTGGEDADVFMWDLGDGTMFNGVGPINHTYALPGTYTVTLTIEDNETGCFDVISKDMIIRSEALVDGRDNGACEPGDPIALTVVAEGATDITWTPSTGLSNPNIFNPVATVDETTEYVVTVTDAAGCVGTDTVYASIYEQPSEALLDSLSIDTTLVIGESIPLNANLGPGLQYEWLNTTYLSCDNYCPNDTLPGICSDCAVPVSTPEANISYAVRITDPADCIQDAIITYNINVRFDSSIDVPTAFTPNGDNINDIIYVDGWGLEELVEFSIYNRYGQLIYQSTNPDKNAEGEFDGWDGYFQDKLQNQETYTYTAIARDYKGDLLTKFGNFHLIR